MDILAGLAAELVSADRATSPLPANLLPVKIERPPTTAFSCLQSAAAASAASDTPPSLSSPRPSSPTSPAAFPASLLRQAVGNSAEPSNIYAQFCVENDTTTPPPKKNTSQRIRKSCTIPGCATTAYARGLCSKHGGRNPNRTAIAAAAAAAATAAAVMSGSGPPTTSSGGVAGGARRQLCTVPGCSSKIRAKGCCAKHRSVGEAVEATGDISLIAAAAVVPDEAESTVRRATNDRGSTGRRRAAATGSSNAATEAYVLQSTQLVSGKGRRRAAAAGKVRASSPLPPRAVRAGAGTRGAGARGAEPPAARVNAASFYAGRAKAGKKGAASVESDLLSPIEKLLSAAKRVTPKRLCSVLHCPTAADGSKAVCVKHGARGVCSHAGCTSNAMARGLCVKHGARGVCTLPGCISNAMTKGRCSIHGGVAVCSFQGCSTNAQTRGLCRRHGGVKKKRCSVDDCLTDTYRRGLCAKHDRARCSFAGCIKNSSKLHGPSRFCTKHA